MPATDTPPVPTADGLAAALALIDAYVPATETMAAVYAVARTAIDLELVPMPGPVDPKGWDRVDRVRTAHEEALAALAALATATGHATATAGEGAS